ncbi:MAG: alginate lyase family protein [Burkholderiales bacterium]|nr:alginate lyase family protein [Burkholderiales bacterium]
MTKASVYWHTLRHLKPIQFYARFWFRLFQPQPDLRPAPQLRSTTGGWVTPARRQASMSEATTFCFLNETRTLDEVGWEGRGLEKLWTYNLHYFDDLNASDARDRCAWHGLLLTRWVADNLPAVGNGWEPYPTSLRIVNWAKWRLTGNVLPDICVKSLATQAYWLNRRIEWHLLGNHLFANAKALVFAGLSFQGMEADALLNKGLSIINKQLPEQVLRDGGHFERSTMYHSVFLEDVLDLINIAQAHSGCIEIAVVEGWRETAGRMLSWLVGMSHPDGQISLFNDAAFSIAPEPVELVAYARRLGLRWVEPTGEGLVQLQHWPDSGYLRLTSRDAVALIDVAPVGPDYLPGHAHADTLSFELSLFDQRVVVNGGTSRYGCSLERSRERQTVSHSTVEVAGESSSEVWGGFRVARRAYPFELRMRQESALLSVTCSHDGYTRLSGKPVHSRNWVMDANGLLVTDQVAPDKYSAVARYILHPTIQVAAAGENEWVLILRGGEVVRVKVLNGRPKLVSHNYASEFGKVLATACLAVTLVEGQARTQLIWH